jgi:hypothetical protein
MSMQFEIATKRMRPTAVERETLLFLVARRSYNSHSAELVCHLSIAMAGPHPAAHLLTETCIDSVDPGARGRHSEL